MSSRTSGGGWAVLGVLLLVGLVIQVVKLLVVPLTILAIGAVVAVPVYLVVEGRRKRAQVLPPPARRSDQCAPEDDGIVSQDDVLRVLPPHIAASFVEATGSEVVASSPPAATDRGSPSPSIPPLTRQKADAAKGQCPVCDRQVRLTAKRRLIATHATGGERCSGTGRSPREFERDDGIGGEGPTGG